MLDSHPPTSKLCRELVSHVIGVLKLKYGKQAGKLACLARDALRLHTIYKCSPGDRDFVCCFTPENTTDPLYAMQFTMMRTSGRPYTRSYIYGRRFQLVLQAIEHLSHPSASDKVSPHCVSWLCKIFKFDLSKNS